MRLGRYDVDELLARGGMGEVYKGRLVAEHGFVRPIVIKLIRTELLARGLVFTSETTLSVESWISVRPAGRLRPT